MFDMVFNTPLDYFHNNPFLVNVPYICPLKTPAKQRFSRVFRVHKIETLTGNGINKFAPSFFHATQQFLQNRDDRAGNYMLKVNNRNTRTKCKLCSKLAVRRKQLHFLL